MSVAGSVFNMIGKKIHKQRVMSHFIGIRLTNSTLLDISDELQYGIIEWYKIRNGIDITPSMIPNNLLHLSMNVMDLHDPTNKELFLEYFGYLKEVIQAGATLCNTNGYKELSKIMNMNEYSNSLIQINEVAPLSLKCIGMNHFNKRVIFLDFNDEDNTQYLSVLFQMINSICQSNNISHTKTPFHGHCTLFKTSKLDRIKSNLLQLQHGYDNELMNQLNNFYMHCIKNYNADLTQYIHELQLCEIKKLKHESYYNIIDSIVI